MSQTQKVSSAKIVHKLSFAGENRKSMFLELPKRNRAQVFLQLSKNVQRKLMLALDEEDLIKILDQFDPDVVTDLVQLLSTKKQKELIKKFSDHLREVVEILNQFDPKSAAGLMSLDYIQVDLNEKIVEAAKRFKLHEKRTGRLPTMLVMDSGKLKGYLPTHELGFSKPSEKVEKYVRRVLSIRHNAKDTEVTQLFRGQPHSQVVVLGPEKNVLGVIYSDDILKLLSEAETSALYDFAGVRDEESVTDSTMQKVNHRYKWLIINLGTAFLAAFTVGLFEETISKYVLLAVYMPIVAGMGGNAGTQTLAVLVRGIALSEIDLKSAWPTLKREIAASVFNGLINGILVALIVILVNNDYKVAFILAMAMVINLVVAGFFGTLVPLVMQKLGKDPAASATIFITTATDVLGFVVFLGLATLVLG